MGALLFDTRTTHRWSGRGVGYSARAVWIDGIRCCSAVNRDHTDASGPYHICHLRVCNPSSTCITLTDSVLVWRILPGREVHTTFSCYILTVDVHVYLMQISVITKILCVLCRRVTSVPCVHVTCSCEGCCPCVELYASRTSIYPNQILLFLRHSYRLPFSSEASRLT